MTQVSDRPAAERSVPDGPQEDAERRRLAEARAGVPWRRWGPYLADRQWGTVREDYSEYGAAWDFFTHDHARSRAYRWGEDGLLGICDDQGYLCFALALWNEADPILKERLFGLTGPEGNHSEDVKEYYFHLDSTPTHSYMKALYKYPQRAFPYAELVAEARRRGRRDPEYELLDTGVFAEDRYFDVTVEYAKAGPEDVLVRITAANRGPGPAPLHLLPTIWFRNTWVWGRDARRPELRAVPDEGGTMISRQIRAQHHELGTYWLACDGEPHLLFTENESNAERLWGLPSLADYVKDGINDAVVHGRHGTVNPDHIGTKAAAHYSFTIAPGDERTVFLRLSTARHDEPFAGAEAVFAERRREAEAFYAPLAPAVLTGSDLPGDARTIVEDARMVQRQAFAGLLWSKQWYYLDVEDWLEGDPSGPPPPASRKRGRNWEWRHLNNADVISMPDKWEYPWYAAWDLAFHCIPLALVDPEFAKAQLMNMVREWYMHPNGQLPAYEWAFSDVNPPVHAWAAWRVYKIEQKHWGTTDRAFLESVFHKLLLNFTWWVNRKDPEGRNVFQGGFLGLDNIGVFDRSARLPTGGHLEQSDSTAWMGMFCLNMLTIAVELARTNPVYEDIASKFFEHFLYIAGAMNNIGGEGIAIWDEEDEFCYDVLHMEGGHGLPLKVRSLVGLIPLLAVQTIEPVVLEALPGFRRRLEWFLENRPQLAALVSRWQEPGMGERRLLALMRGHRMKRLLRRMLDPEEFLGDYGVRSVSRHHLEHPYVLHADGGEYVVRYEPAESSSGLFGGNSNWRGPIWFPINYLLIESIQKFHHYYGDDFMVECPTGSGRYLTLGQIADELSLRLIRTFLRDESGRRPVFDGVTTFQEDPHWRDHILFFEYFHGDTGAGLGANHQTGWTALVAKLIEQQGRPS
jgi:hypothetical protein